MVGDPVALAGADKSADNQTQKHRDSKIDVPSNHHDRSQGADKAGNGTYRKINVTGDND